MINKGVYTGDLNNIPVAIDKVTFYRAATVASNKPSTSAGLVETMYMDGGDYAIQRFTSIEASARIWIRSKREGSWNTWVEK
ncbi:hypothetical protein LBYZC6_34610 [Lacrimispora brassicae]